MITSLPRRMEELGRMVVAPGRPGRYAPFRAAIVPAAPII
jgi:hypothetical protein